jgi:hypothetical protein
MAQTIAKDTALRLCREIQAEHHGKWYTLACWFCPVCARVGRDGVPGCLVSPTGYDGCWMVNKRYARRQSQQNGER